MACRKTKIKIKIKIIWRQIFKRLLFDLGVIGVKEDEVKKRSACRRTTVELPHLHSFLKAYICTYHLVNLARRFLRLNHFELNLSGGLLGVLKVFHQSWVPEGQQWFEETVQQWSQTFQQYALFSQLCSNMQGSYFNDYCNWQRIQEFRQFAFESPVKREFIHSICIGQNVAKWP